MPVAEDPASRLMRRFKVNPTSGCWEWIGAPRANLYGMLKVGRSMVYAHRFSYALHKGPIPDGMQVLHQCDNRLCINPEHLHLGTHLDNMREASERNRMRKGEQSHWYYKTGAYHPGASPVLVGGIAYGSQKEAGRALGLTRTRVPAWVRSGQAQRITKEEYNRHVEQGTAYRSPRVRPGNQESPQRKEGRELFSSDHREVARPSHG